MMKRSWKKTRVVAIVVTGLMQSLSSQANDRQADPEVVVGSPSHLVEAGTRFLYIDLLADKKGESFDNSFIGSINRLEADQDYLPFNPYVQIMSRYKVWDAGIGAGYSRMFVDTRDQGGGDGQIESQALHLYLVAARRLPSGFTPYAEVGFAYYDNSFDPIPSWSENGKRTFKLDSSIAPSFAAGCNYHLTDHWTLDAYIRYIDFDIDGEYVFTGDSRAPEPFTFTMEHLAYGLGVKYSF